MHILFLTHYFPPEVNAPASRTYEHARHWIHKCGAQVTVVTNHPNHPKGTLFPGYTNRWVSREDLEGISVIRVKTVLTANAGVFRRIANYLFFMIAATIISLSVKKPDVVIATSPQFFCALAGYFAALLRHKPFVFELRDIWPDSIVTVGAMKASTVLGLLEKLELFLYRRAQLVVVVTDSFRENLIRRGIPSAKIEVITNGVDLEFFRPRAVSPDLVRRIGSEGKFVVSYIGTVGMAHAVDKIVEAAELLRGEADIILLVVGEGAEKAAVQKLITTKSLTNIRSLPGVNKGDVRDYYALSDLIMVTLRNKPLFLSVIPSKIFEIMGMGRAILTTVSGESWRILERAQAAVNVAPEDAGEMAAAIRRLKDQPEEILRMGGNGRRFVESNYDRARSAQALFMQIVHRFPTDRSD